MKKILCLLLTCAFILCTIVPVFAEGNPVIRTSAELQALIDAASPNTELHVDLLPTEDHNHYFEIQNTITINKPLKLYLECADSDLIHLYLKCKSGNAFLVEADNVELNFGSTIYLEGARSNSIYGEAIYVDGDHCLINGGHFDSCGKSRDLHAGTPGNDYDGGAIYVDGTDCTIQNAYFSYCTGKDGGAICVNQHNCHVIDCDFVGCYAEDDGGAIYVCYGTYGFVASGCSFNDCSCKDEDSGQYIEGARDAKVYNCNPHWGEKEYYAYCAFVTSNPLGSFVSSGTLWIIVAVAVVAIACVVVIITKKNKKVAA